jgi:hypothetical protein
VGRLDQRTRRDGRSGGIEKEYRRAGSSNVDIKSLRGLWEGCELVDFYLNFSQHLLRQAKQEAITLCKDANAIANGAKMNGEGRVQAG